MLTGDDLTLTLGGGHMVQYTDVVIKKPSPEIYMVILANVTPINLKNNFYIIKIK